MEGRYPWLLGWRPALHDLNGDDTGHLAGAQIEFLDTLVGVEDDKLTLESLTILSLASIAPVSHFFKPFSWRMKSGWDRDYGGGRLSFVTRVGAGAAVGDERIYGYVLTEPEVRAGFNADAGIGLCAGAGINWGGRMKSALEAGHVFYIDAKERSTLSLSHQWQWSPGGALSAAYESIEQEMKEDRLKVGVSLYF